MKTGYRNPPVWRSRLRTAWNICRQSGRRVAAASLLAVAAQAGAQGMSFESPLAAVDALLDAVGAADTAAIIRILGEKHRDLVDTPDKVDQRVTLQAFHHQAMQKLTLQARDDGAVELVIGDQDWPMPIPLVRDRDGWRFDTAQGREELLRRRIGMHELAAIEAVEAVIDAQLHYVAEDHDGDGALEFAQSFVSQPGSKNGLFWESDGAEPSGASPLSRFVADAEPYLQGRKPGDPFRGYYFRMLTRQGGAARGGDFGYVRDGNMVAGFGILAYPAEYGTTGIMSFIANHQGRIFERDLGEDTAAIAAAIDRFDPEEGWTEYID